MWTNTSEPKKRVLGEIRKKVALSRLKLRANAKGSDGGEVKVA